tara:strand:- start:933 stop:1592 length:660 start_codon:yes stop_codon:yes gene_type:complete
MMSMNKMGLLAGLVLLLAGCASGGGNIPVVDSGRDVSNEDMQSGAGMPPAQQQPQVIDDGGGVVVMIPDQGGMGSRPIESFPVDSQPAPQSSGSSAPSAPQSSGGGLQQDEQLDGPVLSLLTVSRDQESRGDLGGASSSLERAMRIAPREPQVFYRLAQVRLAQGNAAQAEQMAQRGLSFATGRPPLEAGLWELIAQAREQMGNASGAAEARQRARVNL